MTEKSYPWFDDWAVGDGAVASFTDDDYSDIIRKISTSDRTVQSVIPNYGNCFAITETSPATTVQIASGAAIVDGKFYENTAGVDFGITWPGVGTNYYQIVLRKDFAAQTVRLAELGPSLVGYPALTQTDGTTWEIALYKITVDAARNVVITDIRRYAGGEIEGSVKIGEFSPGAVASYIINAIPSFAKNVRLYISGYASATCEIWLQFNGDTGANYEHLRNFLIGDNTHSATRAVADAKIILGSLNNVTTINNAIVVNIFDTQSSKYKTLLSRSGIVTAVAANSANVIGVGQWNSASAITSIRIYTSGGQTFSAGTLISIYADI